MEDKIYVAWQDEVSRSWHTIACLKRDTTGYELIFTQGATKLDEVSKKLFQLKPGNIYRFNDLIPVFKNKIPPKSRPDFDKMAAWLGVEKSAGEFELLKAFGLVPSSDSTLTYPAPKIDQGQYRLRFFVHGIRHRHPEAVKETEGLAEGQRLLPLLDVQNPVDPNAVALQSASGLIVGYVPAFYAADLKKLLTMASVASEARIFVKRNNQDSPIQIRLLCEFTAPAPSGFRVLDSESHRPLLSKAATPSLRIAPLAYHSNVTLF